MNTSRLSVALSIAATVVAGCTDRRAPTSLRDHPAPLLDAAGSLTSIVQDAIGDAAWNGNQGPGSSAKVPAWLDIRSASITRQGNRFTFQIVLAAPVPVNPDLDPDIPPQADHVLFTVFGLDVDPTTAPVGYPFNKNEANSQEFYLGVGWNPTGSFGIGTGFIGFLIDRRPLLTGGDALITAIPFSIQGTQVSAFVDAAALGDPARFAWAAFTHLQEKAHPPDNGPILDVAPEVFSGAPLATWPL